MNKFAPYYEQKQPVLPRMTTVSEPELIRLKAIEETAIELGRQILAYKEKPCQDNCTLLNKAEYRLIGLMDVKS